MTIRMIWAQSSNGFIGKDNQLLFRIRSDLSAFAALTRGSIVIMGRKTWESLPGPLKGRYNVVLTRNPRYEVDPKHDLSVEVIHDLKDFLNRHANTRDIWIIGGSKVYNLAMEYCKEIYVTEVMHNFNGDAKAPILDLEAFRATSITRPISEFCQINNRELIFRFRKYVRRAFYFKRSIAK